MSLVFFYRHDSGSVVTQGRCEQLEEESGKSVAIPEKGDTVTRKGKTWRVEAVIFMRMEHRQRSREPRLDHLIILVPVT
jgi:hypothetical protein